ncbi:MAG: hypothetical protein RLZ98_572 [Pseudomonadota bacterium]
MSGITIKHGAPTRACVRRSIAAVAIATCLVAAGCSGSDLSLDGIGHGPSPSPDSAAPGIVTGALPASKSTSADASARQPADTEVAAALADAQSLRSSGRKQQALKRLEQGSDPENPDPAILKTRALLALELGQLDKSEKLLRRALKTDTGDWRLHSALGTALSAKGRQHDAQLAFAKALELSPENPVVLNNLALSYALASRSKQAESLLRRVIASKAPSQHVDRARLNLALLLGLKGRIKEAESMTRAVLPAAAASSNMRILSRAGPESEPPQRRSASASTLGEGPVYRLGGPSTND